MKYSNKFDCRMNWEEGLNDLQSAWGKERMSHHLRRARDVMIP